MKPGERTRVSQAMRRAAACACVAAACGAAQAGVIRMTLELTVSPEEITVGILNEGDEAAFDVQILAELEGQIFAGPLVPQLDPGTAVTNALPFKLEDMRGTFPLIAEAGYSDADGHPFSAIACCTVNGQDARRSTVNGSLAEMRFARRGDMVADLVNESGTLRTVSVRPVVSREFKVVREAVVLTIPARGRQEVRLPVETFTALAPSTHAAFLVIEYDENDLHHAAVLAAPLEVVPRAPGLPVKPLGAAVAGLLVLAVAAFLMHARGAKNRASPTP